MVICYADNSYTIDEIRDAAGEHWPNETSFSIRISDEVVDSICYQETSGRTYWIDDLITAMNEGD